MSLFLRGIDSFKYLKEKADVYGTMRLSISFDTPSDRARFDIELRRDIKNILDYGSNHIIEASEFTISGIKVRLL